MSDDDIISRRFDKMSLRVAALEAVGVWVGNEIRHDCLAALFDFKDWHALREFHIAEAGDDKLSKHLYGLIGPHGYAYYKMLLAQKEASNG
jgi:hypothetical protein